MNYLPNYPETNPIFEISYKELKSIYEEILEYTDEEFISKAANILHTCCAIAYFKELSGKHLFSDIGLLHELVHLIIGTRSQPIHEIRKSFKIWMELS